MDMQRLQESAYDEARNYRDGSPHLVHWRLYDHLTAILRDVIADVVAAGLPATVLEIGAGHGGYTEPALAAGAKVVATEMSRPSIARLEERYGANPQFRAVFDPDGSLEVLGDEQFSVIVCSSVLHHIPDYLGFLSGPMLAHLSPGGSFFSLQDPLWYPTVGTLTRKMDRWAYLLWRVTRGNYKQGFATMGRRVRGVYDDDNAADMVEYHVVRQGIDHVAVERLLQQHFDHVELGAYWSTASRVLQRAGERLDHPNTFFARATKLTT
ncbi:MAG: Methyltransferase type 12 [Acidimicrobiales bacterium]|nr:Methyltransferase type 12 [Acidimicrobiales bacterium]